MNYYKILQFVILDNKYNSQFTNTLLMIEEESFNHVLGYTLKNFDLTLFKDLISEDSEVFAKLINEFITNIEENPLNATSKEFKFIEDDINKIILFNLKFLIKNVDFLCIWESFFEELNKIEKRLKKGQKFDIIT